MFTLIKYLKHLVTNKTQYFIIVLEHILLIDVYYAFRNGIKKAKIIAGIRRIQTPTRKRVHNTEK